MLGYILLHSGYYISKIVCKNNLKLRMAIFSSIERDFVCIWHRFGETTTLGTSKSNFKDWDNWKLSCSPLREPFYFLLLVHSYSWGAKDWGLQPKVRVTYQAYCSLTGFVPYPYVWKAVKITHEHLRFSNAPGRTVTHLPGPPSSQWSWSSNSSNSC